MENRRKKKNRKEVKKISKKFSWKLLFKFIGFELIFTMITAPFVLLYGPFDSAKSMFVGTAMSSMSYQWLATTFLSDAEIAKITGNTQSSDNMEEQDGSLIEIPTVKDDNITYAVLENNSSFLGHVLIVNDPTRIAIGYTSKLNSPNPEGETTSLIATNFKATAAVNGGAFTDEADTAQWTANGGTPSGIIISNGKVVYDDTAGKEAGTIAMTEKGRLIVGTYTINQLISMGVTEAVSYNTTVLINNAKETPMSGDGGEGSCPRTLIGQRKDGSIVLVVLDSATDTRMAATLKQAQEVMATLECVTAATLDGGKSTTMYYNGEVVNTPSYALGERSIPTAVIVK